PTPTAPPSSNTTAPPPSTTTPPPSTPPPTTPATPSAPPPTSPPPPPTPSATPPASTPPPPPAASPPSPPSSSPPPPPSSSPSPPSSPPPPSPTTPSSPPPPSSTTPSTPTSKSSPPPPTSTNTPSPAGTTMQNPPPPPPVASRPSPPPERVSMPPPPPPPLFMSSSGGSGSNYSGIALGFSKSTFSYEELARATDGFTDANLLGQGGFGYVHRGVLPNGKEVAVKQLKAGSGQGEREFQAEVEIISRVHHKHLVSLVGYCITGAHRLLVYEFVPNNTLEFHLHGHPKIIHRDIKASNILLDFKFEAKCLSSDDVVLVFVDHVFIELFKHFEFEEFSLLEFCVLGPIQCICIETFKPTAIVHIELWGFVIFINLSSGWLDDGQICYGFVFYLGVTYFVQISLWMTVNMKITYCSCASKSRYLAPEYASSGKLTDKSDVFSFGVMLLELITGRRPVDSTQTFMEDSLVDWARPLLTRALEDGNFDTLVDQKLQNNYDQNEMARMVACAAACVRHSARRRPRTSQVVRALEGDVSLSDLNEGIRPGNSRVYGSYGSSDYDTSQYNEDMKKFRKMALGSQEYGGSSEYSGPTSEYGLYPSGSSSEGQNTREMEMGKMKKASKGFSGSSSDESGPALKRIPSNPMYCYRVQTCSAKRIKPSFTILFIAYKIVENDMATALGLLTTLAFVTPPTLRRRHARAGFWRKQVAPSWLAGRLVHLLPKVRILDGSPDENKAVKMERRYEEEEH
ncbi:hypothetical protein D5086_032025, partial [Populus alba]